MRIFVASAAHVLTDREGHGEGLIAWNFLSRLAARGHDIIACTTRVALRSNPVFEVVTIPKARGPQSLAPLSYARHVERAFRAAHEERPIDVAWWMFPIGTRDAVWSPPDGVPFTIGPYSPGWPSTRERPRGVRAGAHRIIDAVLLSRHQQALDRLDLLLCALPGVRAAYVGNRDVGVRLVPFGADLPAYTDPEDGGTIVFVGSLEERKGVLDLAEAFVGLVGEDRDARLVVAGTGSLEPVLRDRFRAAGVVDRVNFLGRVEHTDVSAVFQRGAVACVPSHGEPYGLVVVEAMAAGRPVVTTDVGGPPHLVQLPQGGRAVPPGSPDELQAALAEVLDLSPDAWAQMATANRARVERTFTWEACVDQLEEALEFLSGLGPDRTTAGGPADG